MCAPAIRPIAGVAATVFPMPIAPMGRSARMGHATSAPPTRNFAPVLALVAVQDLDMTVAAYITVAPIAATVLRVNSVRVILAMDSPYSA